MIRDLKDLKESISLDMNENNNLIKNNVKNILNNYSGNDWKKYIKLDPNNYCKQLVFKENNFAIYIITWNKKQGSLIHDHSSNGCVYKILSGDRSDDSDKKRHQIEEGIKVV